MKNKGFTLVEILAVIVILGILATMATIGITRIRKNANEKDLLLLHSSLQDSFTNYRTKLVSSGDSHLTGITIDNDMPIDFNEYVTSLSYNGAHLNKTVLYGTTIKVHVKGDLLSNVQYSKDIAEGIANYDSLSQDEQFSLLQEQFIKDAACIVESSMDNVTADGSPEKHCKMENGKPVPSKDEIICQKIIYKGDTVIDDYAKTDKALSFQRLCKYLSN